MMINFTNKREINVITDWNKEIKIYVIVIKFYPFIQ